MARIPMGNTAPESVQQNQFPQNNDNKKREWPLIPDGTCVEAEIVKCELRDYPEDFKRKFNPKFDQEVSFQFKVAEGQYKNQSVWGSARPEFTDDPDCRLRLWTQEILGVDTLPQGYVFDTEDLVGMRANVVIAVKRNKNTGKERNAVDDVMRVNTSYGNSHDEDSF